MRNKKGDKSKKNKKAAMNEDELLRFLEEEEELDEEEMEELEKLHRTREENARNRLAGFDVDRYLVLHYPPVAKNENK
jgi:hypothetical protein